MNNINLNVSFEYFDNSYRETSYLTKRSSSGFFDEMEMPVAKKAKYERQIKFTKKSEKVEIQKSQIVANGQFKKLYPATFWDKENHAHESLFAKFINPKERFVKREVYLLEKIKNNLPEETRGICQSYGTCQWNSKIGEKQGFIFPFYNGGHLGDAQSLSKKESLTIALDVAYGLQALHSLNILHNDLKPDNICLTKDPKSQEITNAHIIDFGIGVDLSHEKEKFFVAASNKWGSPESKLAAQTNTQENLQQLTGASDIYSFAKILDFLNLDSDDIYALMQDGLSKYPSYRPTIDHIVEVLQNHYTQEYGVI